MVDTKAVWWGDMYLKLKRNRKTCLSLTCIYSLTKSLCLWRVVCGIILPEGKQQQPEDHRSFWDSLKHFPFREEKKKREEKKRKEKRKENVNLWKGSR